MHFYSLYQFHFFGPVLFALLHEKHRQTDRQTQSHFIIVNSVFLSNLNLRVFGHWPYYLVVINCKMSIYCWKLFPSNSQLYFQIVKMFDQSRLTNLCSWTISSDWSSTNHLAANALRRPPSPEHWGRTLWLRSPLVLLKFEKQWLLIQPR